MIAVQQRLQIFRDVTRIGDVFVAQRKRFFGGFHDTVHRLRIVSLRHLQPIGDAQDRQRHHALRWRGDIPDVTFAVGEMQRRRAAGAMLLQIGQRHRHAQRGHLIGHMVSQRAAIKAVESLFSKLAQGVCQGGLGKTAAWLRHVAVRHKGGAEAGLMLQFTAERRGGGAL